MESKNYEVEFVKGLLETIIKQKGGKMENLRQRKKRKRGVGEFKRNSNETIEPKIGVDTMTHNYRIEFKKFVQNLISGKMTLLCICQFLNARQNGFEYI